MLHVCLRATFRVIVLSLQTALRPLYLDPLRCHENHVRIEYRHPVRPIERVSEVGRLPALRLPGVVLLSSSLCFL